MSEAIERAGGGQLDHAMSVENVMAQIRAIQELMTRAMRPNEHYGIIPGTSRKDKDGKEMAKPSLLKAGAEKISLMFRLAPSYTGQDTPILYDRGHVGYLITCTLTHINRMETWGQGVGSCSTMETKYRFRNQKTDTGEPIPDDYKANKGHYRAQGFVAAKDENDQWIWAKLERVEHDNPADYYNTALKIAKKRAYVDAILSATAASDFFTQDLEDMADNGLIDGGEKKETAKSNAPATPTKAKPADNGKPQFDGGPEGLDVFDTLEKELAEFCDGDPEAMQEKLQALTSFPGMKKDKNGKYTKEPSGEMIPGMRFISEMRMKGKNSWAGSALDKLRNEANGER